MLLPAHFLLLGSTFIEETKMVLRGTGSYVTLSRITTGADVGLTVQGEKRMLPPEMVTLCSHFTPQKRGQGQASRGLAEIPGERRFRLPQITGLGPCFPERV